MEETKDTQIKANIGVTVFLFLLAAGIIFFSIREQIRIGNEPEINASLYPDYAAIQRMQKVTIVKNFETWTPDSEIPDAYVKELGLVRTGRLSRGYVYVRATVEGSALTKWESVYVKLDEAGGHLFRSKSLPIPHNGKTELLYALDDVPYLSTVPYAEDRSPEHADWFSLLNEKPSMYAFTFISSLRLATIEELSIYYDCTTGSDCSLSLE